jgi:hypothetical protein
VLSLFLASQTRVFLLERRHAPLELDQLDMLPCASITRAAAAPSCGVTSPFRTALVTAAVARHEIGHAADLRRIKRPSAWRKTVEESSDMVSSR